MHNYLPFITRNIRKFDCEAFRDVLSTLEGVPAITIEGGNNSIHIFYISHSQMSTRPVQTICQQVFRVKCVPFIKIPYCTFRCLIRKRIFALKTMGVASKEY